MGVLSVKMGTLILATPLIFWVVTMLHKGKQFITWRKGGRVYAPERVSKGTINFLHCH